MERQPSTSPSQYQYQSEQWSRFIRRKTLADFAPNHPVGIVAPAHLPTNFELVPIFLPQPPTYHHAQVAQYNKLIASARTSRLQTPPLPPLLFAETIQAVPRPRLAPPSANTDRHNKTSSRGGHGNRGPRKHSKGERALITDKEISITMPPRQFDLSNQLPPRPLAQHQSSTFSQQSNSVPSTPHQHARDFAFDSREPSPNAMPSHSPRSAYSESDTRIPHTIRPLPPRYSNGCCYETAIQHTKRRIPYSVGGERLEALDPAGIKSKLTKDEEQTLTTDMRELYGRLLPTQESEVKRQKLVVKLEQLLNKEWPGHDIQVHVFGSSGNLLCTDSSDVDICITTQWKQLEGVCMIAALLARSGMEKVICVSTAKVPIVKIWDPELSLACDMNVNNTTALENTRMIKTYVEIDTRVRPLAMIIKHWTKQRILNDAAFGGTLSSYTWICMIINFLQTRVPPVVPSLHQRKHQILPSKNGTESQFADDLDSLRDFGQKNKDTLGELLFQFFRFYSHEFDYDNLVVSVRNGTHITKMEKNWHVGNGNNNLCVEEPFNQARNLGNTADDTSFRGLHMELRRAFDFIAEAKLKECCEQFEFPEVEEKPIFERRKPQPTPVISRSASSSTRGGRNNRGRNQHRNSNSSRRSSSGAFDHNSSYTSHGPANAEQEQWLQRQAQVQLHNELFTKYTVLQQEEIRLRQYQAFQQQQVAQQAYVQAQHQKAQARGPKQQVGDRSRTSSFDQAPLSAPLRQEMYFYPLQYQPTPVYTYQGPSTNPPSPSMGNALPELRRSVHRSSVTNGSGSGAPQSSSALRSHSQPASRSAQSPLSVHGAPMPEQGLHGLGLLQTMQYGNGQPVPNFIADEALDHNLEGASARPGARMRPDESTPKEYVGYYVNNSPATLPRRQAQASLAIPAFGDLGQNRRRLSTDQFPQSILDRLRRTSRSPSPLGDGRRDRSSSVDAPLITQHNVSSTNLRALNNQGPLVVNGSNIPMSSVTSGWIAPRSDRSASEDHNSEVAIGSYGSASQDSDVGSETTTDQVSSGQSTPKISWNSDQLKQPVVVNGSLPIPSNEHGYSSNGVSTSNGITSPQDSVHINGFTTTEQVNGTLRLSPSAQRTGRQMNNNSISPVDVSFNQNDNQPHLSPVYETRTPSPTANRKLEAALERTLNGNSAKDVKLEQTNSPARFAPIKGSQLKPLSTSDAKSNGHIRSAKSEGGGPGSWQKASKQKKKGQASEHKNVPNGQSFSEKLPHNHSERKGG